jgi:hypothetical protein
LSGRTLQTNHGLGKELVGVPMLFPTGVQRLVAKSVHLGHVESAMLKSSYHDSAARSTQVDGHIAAHL